jgi:hypothetical protein
VNPREKEPEMIKVDMSLTMSLTDAEKNRLKKVGLTGLNKPKRTPGHKKKRFGAQGMGHNYSPEARKSFKARHGKNIKKGKSFKRQVQHTGQTKYFGQGKVAVRNPHLSHRSIGLVK